VGKKVSLLKTMAPLLVATTLVLVPLQLQPLL
jgi:hypothetical protein